MTENKEMAKSKYQTSTSALINRSLIKEHPDNPREIQKENFAGLKRGVKKRGLISNLTWNKRTGNLLGGHQRLLALDELERNRDYSLEVCVVDIPEEEEMDCIISLNNDDMAGEWNTSKLNAAIKKHKIVPQELGFKMATLNILGVEAVPAVLTKTVSQEEYDRMAAEIKRANEEKSAQEKEKKADKVLEKAKPEYVEAAKEKGLTDKVDIANYVNRQNLRDFNAARDEANEDEALYICVLFESRADREKFLEERGLDIDTIYVKHEIAFQALVK